LIATVLPLYRFLRNDFAAASAGSLWIDAAAAVQFVIPHSLLLQPSVRRAITRRLRSELYGCLFTLMTCAGLWIQFILWRGSPIVLCAWPESLKPVIWLGFFASWGGLFYSFWLNGLGYQTGFTPWRHWMRHMPVPRREFRAAGVFRYLRHPAYLSFLGLVWCTPIVTADRAVLIVVWTTYVFIGSYLKDERLARMIGEPYRRYMEEVPGYPFVLWGPLGRRRARLVSMIPSKAGGDAPADLQDSSKAA
jgi:protein-S-isoprenylcysteine O-methyltransferase Ste14